MDNGKHKMHYYSIYIVYTDEDLNPHNHRRWLYVLHFFSFQTPIIFVVILGQSDTYFHK